MELKRYNAMWLCEKCKPKGMMACAQNCPRIKCLDCGNIFVHHNGWTPKYCATCCVKKIVIDYEPVEYIPIRCQRCGEFNEHIQN